jgi:hypothetical protein
MGRRPSAGSRFPIAALSIAFVLTRILGAWLADHPDQYGRNVTSDVGIYQYWANRIAGGEAPYTDVPVEYPPASLPFIVVPEWLAGLGSYRAALIGLMVAIDVLGLIGLLLTARRWGSLLGPWLWIVVIPLLGPIVYLRLDLVPAVATIWAVERMSAGAWGAAGGSVAVGALAKLYPAVLLPIGFLGSPRRRRFLVGAGALVVLALLPFAASPRGLIRNVIEHHAGRDIHIESTWGLVLLTLSKLGLEVSVGFDAGSFNAVTPASSVVRALALASALLALGAATVLAARVVRRGDGVRLAALMYATVTFTVALSTVFSPQFVLWMLAVGAAAVCATLSPIRGPVLLLVPIAATTQILFPFHYGHLIAVDAGGLALLALRNILVLGSGALAFVLVWRRRVTAGTPAGDESPTPTEDRGRIGPRPEARETE